MASGKLQFLLVEDDIDLATAVIDYLELEDINCDHASNGLSALKLSTAHYYDALILDLNLPKISGLEVCETLRSQGIDVPILMLTAKDTLDDKLIGFSKGADDYLIKPFAMQELIVRLQVLARRRSGQVSKLKVGELILDSQQKLITLQEIPLKLSPISFKILSILMHASPYLVSREKLLHSVWGDDHPDTNTLKVHIFNLRKSLDKNQCTDNKSSQLIKTLVGRGFILNHEVEK